MKNFWLKLLSIFLHCCGVFCGVYFFIVLRVNLILHELRDVDAADWPNMDLRFLFAFIPIFFCVLSVVGLMGVLIAYSFGWKLRLGFPFLLNGFVYSLPTCFLVFLVLLNFWLSVVLWLIIFVFSLVFLNKYFADRVGIEDV